MPKASASPALGSGHRKLKETASRRQCQQSVHHTKGEGKNKRCRKTLEESRMETPGGLLMSSAQEKWCAFHLFAFNKSAPRRNDVEQNNKCKNKQLQDERYCAGWILYMIIIDDNISLNKQTLKVNR